MAFDVGIIFAQWEQAGLYEYILPMLLVFAIVFGILSTTNVLGTNRGMQVIIALIIALMSITYTSRMNFSLGQFMGEAFPRLGVGLAVLIIIMILIGLFVDIEVRKYWLYGLSAIAAVIAIVIIVKSFETFGWVGTGSYDNYVGWIIGAVLVIGLIIAVASSGKPKNEEGVTHGSHGRLGLPWNQ